MRARSSLLVLAVVAACDRPQPLVICHNGNCVGDAVVGNDDTLEALQASLDLRWNGRPTLDGVEIDTMWHRPTRACLFEHGPGEVLPADTAADAGDLLVRHLALPEVAWNGDRFYVAIELKGYVAGRFTYHTADELALHADCVLDLYERLVAAAAGRHRLQIVFESSAVETLEALVRSSRWPGRLDGDVEVRLAGESGGIWDAAIQNPRLAEYTVQLDVMEYLAGYAYDAQVAAYRSLGVELWIWSYATTPDVLSAIEQDEPSAVLTSEATMLRRWLTR